MIAAALSNMGERFGYYIMNAVLVLFLCSKFGLSEETSGTIYSFFYAGIYLLALVGGIIADRTQNYKGTIKTGLIIMAAGYVLLSIPILATSGNVAWLLPLTCFSLFLIAFGNGLFKGNLQAIVGQLYDDFEAESDAIIVKGIVSLLVRVLSGRTPDEILNADLYFIDRIGLTEHLSPTRSNGLVAMVKQMRMYALAFKVKNN